MSNCVRHDFLWRLRLNFEFELKMYVARLRLNCLMKFYITMVRVNFSISTLTPYLQFATEKCLHVANGHHRIFVCFTASRGFI